MIIIQPLRAFRRARDSEAKSRVDLVEAEAMARCKVRCDKCAVRGTVKKGFGISRGWMVKKGFGPYEGFGF